MKQNDWIDRLDDKEISRLVTKKPRYKEISDFTDNKLLNIIRDREKIYVERKKIYFVKLSRYALSFSIIIILILFSYIFLFKNLTIPGYNKCFVTELNGSVVIENKSGKIKDIQKTPYKVVPLDKIFTRESSSLKLNIGNISTLYMNESSELIINKIYKKNDIEKTDLFVESGDINFKPKLISKDSVFQVETELITINVTGTDFTVKVDKDKNTNVFVKEGSILIKPKINITDLDKIRKIDPGFSDRLKSILYSGIILNKDENIEILYSDFKEIESKIINIINSIYIELNKNKDSKTKINEIINESKESINELIDLKNKLLQKVLDIRQSFKLEEKKKDKFTFYMLPLSIGLTLIEKNTYITNNDNSMYISSDSNDAVYSINPLNGTIKWKFNDSEIKDITSALIPFKDKLILCTSNSIFILDKNGKVILKKNLNSGVTYWAKCIVAKDKVFIPTDKYLYFYDGEKVEILENFPESSGQLYISYFQDKLFCFDSNELNIKIFDLINNRIIWTSSSLKDRAFIEPQIINNIIYITDIKNNLYKFDYLKSSTPQIINIGTGNLTNIINNDDKIYFIGINGYFYEIKNNSVKKLFKVDKQPVIDNYLTKKLILYNDMILFCSDTGNIFYYEIMNDKAELLEIPQNKNKLPLVGTPVIINNNVYFIDTGFHIYRLSINL